MDQIKERASHVDCELINERKHSTEAAQSINEGEKTDKTMNNNNSSNNYIPDDDDDDELGGDNETFEEFAAKLKIMEQREDDLMAHARQMLKNNGNYVPMAEGNGARRRQADNERANVPTGRREGSRRARIDELDEDSEEYAAHMRMISEQDAALIAEVHALLNDEEPAAARRRNRSQQNLAELMAELNAMPNRGNGPRMPRGPVFCMSLRDFLFVADENAMDEGEEENARAMPPQYVAQGDRTDSHNILFFPDYSVNMNEEEDEEERIATNNFNAALENFFNMRAEQGRPSVTLGRDLLQFLTFLERGE